jgi:hypothetical protein
LGIDMKKLILVAIIICVYQIGDPLDVIGAQSGVPDKVTGSPLTAAEFTAVKNTADTADALATVNETAITTIVGDAWVAQSNCATITSGWCRDTDDNILYYWNGVAVESMGNAGTVDLNGTVNADEVAVFHDADTLKALTEAEFKAAYNMVAGTDYLAPNGDGTGLTISIADCTTATSSGSL